MGTKIIFLYLQCDERWVRRLPWLTNKRFSSAEPFIFYGKVLESKKCYICGAVRRPAKAERAVLFINPSLNNIVVLFIDFAPVVICFQIHYLWGNATTSLENSIIDRRLWFAFRFITLEVTQQLRYRRKVVEIPKKVFSKNTTQTKEGIADILEKIKGWLSSSFLDDQAWT